MSVFIKRPCTKRSVSHRRPLYGVGINDAPYVSDYIIDNKRFRCPYYRRWGNIFKRCYSDADHKSNPTYIECSVHSDWLSFMKFREWMEQQNWEGMQLDKDLIVPNNKVYGPYTCCFIPSKLNSLLLNCGSARGKYPQGVCFDKGRNKYKSECRGNCKRFHLGYFDTPEEASLVYKKFKADLIIEQAQLQTDERIKNGLILHAELLLNCN